MSCNHVGESVPAGPGSCPALQQVEDQHCHCREGAARPQYQQGQHRNQSYPPPSNKLMVEAARRVPYRI
jgi:hypothetical protein